MDLALKQYFISIFPFPASHAQSAAQNTVQNYIYSVNAEHRDAKGRILGTPGGNQFQFDEDEEVRRIILVGDGKVGERSC